MKYHGEFPVIRIDFKMLKEDNYTSVYNSYKGLIANLYNDKRYLLDSLKDDRKEMFLRFLTRNAYDDEYKKFSHLKARVMLIKGILNPIKT